MRGTTKFCWWGIVALSGASALVVLGGAVAILASGGVGAGAPGSLLAGQAGALVTAPEWVLLLEIGGLQLVALLIMLTHRPATLRWGRVLGVGAAIGVGVGAATLGGYSVLHSFAIMAGLVELTLVVILLAILPHIAKHTRGHFFHT